MNKLSRHPYAVAFALTISIVTLVIVTVLVDAHFRERSGPFLHISPDDVQSIRLEKARMLSSEIVASSIMRVDQAVFRLENIGYTCEVYGTKKLSVALENSPSLKKLGITSAFTCTYRLDMLGDAMKVLIYSGKSAKIVHYRAFIYYKFAI